jgi:hypothetical protein
MFGVLQLAYLSLGSHDQLSPFLAPLVDLRMTNGLTLPYDEPSQYLPSRLSSLGFVSSFLGNCNAMALLLGGWCLMAVLFYLLARFTRSLFPAVFSLANRLLKEVLLTLLLFNLFNVSYSAAIHINYHRFHSLLPNIAMGVCGGILLCMILGVLCGEEAGFGEFKDKFGEDPIRRNYLAITLVYRAGLGYLLASQNEDDLSTLWAVGISLLWLIYNLVNLPFIKAYHNYRACLCHIAQFVTLFTAMYYRSMKSTAPPQTVASIYLPAQIEVCLVLLCLVFSIVVLFYDLAVWLTNCCNKVETK